MLNDCRRMCRWLSTIGRPVMQEGIMPVISKSKSMDHVQYVPLYLNNRHTLDNRSPVFVFDTHILA